MRRTYIIGATVAIVVIAVLATIIIDPGLLGLGAEHKAGISELDMELPRGYSISSFTSYGDTFILCCYGLGTYGSDYSILTYKHGDSGFQDHPIDFSVTAYNLHKTALLVVNDTVYFFYTEARNTDGSERYISYLWKVSTSDWTLYDRQIVLLPSRFDPGVKVSDGNYIFIIGGHTSSLDPAVWQKQANDTIYRLDVSTSKAQAIATLPGAATMNGVFMGEELVLFSGSGETNCGSVMDWSTARFFDVESGRITSPGDLTPLGWYGTAPASDGESLFFFNPLRLNSSNGWSNYTQEIWYMGTDRTLKQVNLTLPEEINNVAPVRVGDGFLLISDSSYVMSGKITFWWCEL